MTNTISRRIFDFIKDFPPFSLLDETLLHQLSEKVVVQYRQEGDIVFETGSLPEPFIYVVKEGAVHLVRIDDEGNELVMEHCDEGDVFGIRPLLADDQYVLTAKVVEETLLYAVNIAGMRDQLANNPHLAFYLASNMAAGMRKRMEPGLRGQLRADTQSESFQLLELQSLDRSKKPIVIEPQKTIQQAALIMTASDVGSIIVVNEQQFPIGIVTDKDLRRKIATGKYPLDTSIEDIMSSPVVTVASDVTVAIVQIEMVKNRIHHLCVTEDGTDQSEVLGVISEHDILVLQGNNPAVLVREIWRSKTTADLRDIRARAEELLHQYLEQEVSIAYIATIMSEVNDEIIDRCLQLSEEEMPNSRLTDPGVPYCWLSLGSEGREEQLLRTDQDNALVFADVPPEKLESTRAYFLDLANRANVRLNEVGFEFCPADMMARNPQWCLSVSEWKQLFSRWINTPTPKAVMHTTIFFDFRPVYGDASLADALTEHIFGEITDQSNFLSYLAAEALHNPPPLTFFRNLVVERSGENKDEFDIKARAMMPLTDAARVLILHAQVGHINNTFRRFERLAEIEPAKKELYEAAADAYEILMRLRALQGLKNKDSGRYFNPGELTKMERIHLRNCFQPVKELQSLLKVRFQTSYFN